MSSDKEFCNRMIAQSQRKIESLKLKILFYEKQLSKIKVYQKRYRGRNKKE